MAQQFLVQAWTCPVQPAPAIQVSIRVGILGESQRQRFASPIAQFLSGTSHTTGRSVSPGWHTAARRRRHSARLLLERHQSGAIVSNKQLDKAAVLLRGHHATPPSQLQVLEAAIGEARISASQMGAKTWPCGRCGWTLREDQKGCWDCQLARPAAEKATKSTPMGVWASKLKE